MCAITSCKAYLCEVTTAIYCYYAKEGGRCWVKNLGWKFSDSFWIPVEDLGWKSRIGKNYFRIWGRFPTSGRRTTLNPETLGNARSFPRFFRIRKLDPTGSELKSVSRLATIVARGSSKSQSSLELIPRNRRTRSNAPGFGP